MAEHDDVLAMLEAYMTGDPHKLPLRRAAQGSGRGPLDALRAELGDCTRCGLCAQRTNIVFGAGSPQAQRIMIARQGNLERKKELAKAIAGIPGLIK